MNPLDVRRPNALLVEDEEPAFDMWSFEDPFLSMIDHSTGDRVAFRLSQVRSIIRYQDSASVCVNCETLDVVSIKNDTADFLEGLLASYVGFIDLDKKTANTQEP